MVRAFAVDSRRGRGTVHRRHLPEGAGTDGEERPLRWAKAASDALVLALADELRGTGSTANLVVVDSIDFPATRGSGPRKPYGKSTPAEEIAAAMLFLCSDEAATINGVRVPLTGRG